MTRIHQDSEDRKTASAGEPEADHRIGNSLAFLAAMLRHESRRISSVEEANLALVSAANRLTAIARFHKALGQSGRDGRVQLLPYLTELSETLAEILDIEIRVNGEDIAVRADTAGCLAVVISELATNALKHAGAFGRTKVDVTFCANDPLVVLVEDNGHGFPDGFDIDDLSGLGMTIVTSNVEKHGGTVTLQNGPGAKFRIVLPD